MITAEIISIGDELLIGQTINTNAGWMGEKLNLAGIEVLRTTVIPDKREQILKALQEAAQRADIILTTGGLGPTRDDITKHTLCEFFNTELVRNTEVLKYIEAFFARRGREMLEVNRMQADLPKRCTVIHNSNGTASGMWFDVDNKVYVSMPGVPFEMKGMMEDSILDMLAKRFELTQIVHKTILTQGIGESFLAEQIKDWENRIYNSGMSLAYLPSPGMVKLRITSKQPNPPVEIIESLAAELADRFPQYVFGEDKDTLEEVCGNILRTRSLTLCTVESCTGGAIAGKITSVSGSSDYFMGAMVTYSNKLKTLLAAVSEPVIEDFGAVSEEVVVAMARGGKEKMQTDYCIAVSGIAGPMGGSEQKPVGTVWIAVAGPERVFTKKFLFGNNRQRNIDQSVLSALNMLRLELLNNA
jgi:nicotinamide-nucleotide amidase